MKTRSTLEEISASPKFEDYFSDFSQGSLSTLVSPEVMSANCKETRRRNRKNNEQISLLISEFESNQNWDKDTISLLANRTGLSEGQVYKWNWDYKKKYKRYGKSENLKLLICGESMAPSEYDKDILIIQRLYKLGFTSVPQLSPSRYLFNRDM